MWDILLVILLINQRRTTHEPPGSPQFSAQVARRESPDAAVKAIASCQVAYDFGKRVFEGLGFKCPEDRT